MNDESPYAPPLAPTAGPRKSQEAPRVGVVLAIGVGVAATLNVAATMRLAAAKGAEGAEKTGMVVGSVVILPLIIVGLFQWGKSNRNWRTRAKIFFYASLVFWLSSITQLQDLLK